MKKPLTLLPSAALSLFVAACSSSHPASTSPGASNFAPGPTTFTLNATVAPSSEVFKCTYVTMPATAGFITGGAHEYTPGSHHLLLYKTDLTAIPAGEASPNLGDCYEGNADYMSHITGVVYPAATPTGELTMPAGVGLPFKANDIYLFQVHYLNTGATTLTPQVNVHLVTQTTPVQQNAGVLFFYDPFIYVPQGAQGAKAGMRCPISKDITMFTQASHYHARGVSYQAYLDPATGPQSTTPFYTSADWASPVIQQNTMKVPAGSFIRYYCDYDNTQGAQSFIQGQSAKINEMCMYIGLYYPAMTANDENCMSGDQFGTGSVACGATLSCLTGCPPNSSGPLGVSLNECTQKCFVDSCPSASQPLLGALNCIQGTCAAECGGSSDAGTSSADAGANSACTSCVASKCLTQYSSCSNHTCP